MQLTNGEIFNAKAPLEALLQVKFHVKVSYSLAKLGAKFNTQLQVIDQVRNGLIREYGEPDKGNPNQISVTEANKPKFLEELGELFSEVVEIDFEPVALPADFHIAPAVLMALEKFVTISK